MEMRVRTKILLVASSLLVAAPLDVLPAAAAAPPAPTLLRAPIAGEGTTLTTPIVEAPGRFDLAGLSWTGDHAHVELRASDDGRNWTPWTDAPDITEDGPDRQSSERHARRATQPIWTGGARYAQFRVEADAPVGDLRLEAVDALGHTESFAAKVARHLKGLFRSAPAAPAGAMTAQPAIVTRAQWGADESIRKGSPSYGTVKLGVLHHTVNANDYSAAEAPALVRGIYVYHVKTNGWNDIGYNFLVDRFGTIYEGRYGGIDRPVIGAQAEGFNTWSFGVSMLGTFSSVTPSAAMLDAVKRLFAWRLDVAHVQPNVTTSVTSGGNARFPAGTVVNTNTISGHRDLGQTACPGDLGYAQLGAIRSAVATMGLPKIYDPAITARTIEGTQKTSYQSTTVTARASASVPWAVRVRNGDGTEIKTFTATAPSISFTWNGTDNQGRNVPMGTYLVSIEADGARPAAFYVDVVDTDLLKPVTRLFGADRYATAVAASQRLASPGGDVVLASGAAANLVDSLVAAPLAKAKRAPILLTIPTVLPSSTAAEIDRLEPATIWVVGGTAAVSDGVVSALTAKGYTVRRLAGADAPATAAAVAAEVGGSGGAIVVAREAAHLVDGLAASGPAAGLGRPVLLVTANDVPPATSAALSGRSPVWAVGGTAAISDRVVSALKARRIAGADRWATATAIATAGMQAGVPADAFVVASGENANLVDALSGGAFARGVVLTPKASLAPATQTFLRDNRMAIDRLWLMGGTAAVSDTVLSAARAAIAET